MHTLLKHYYNEPVVSSWFVSFMSHAQRVPSYALFPRLSNFVFFLARVMSSWRKKLPSACTICKRNTKYSCIKCGKSVCVRVECSIAEEKEDTLGWEANRSVGYCLPCAGTSTGAGQNEFCSENRHPSHDIEPAALENESFDEERSDNIEPACELACESDSGEDERFQSTEEEVKKVKRGRKASWNEDQITDMIDIIVNDDEMVKKLIFTNTKKASNSEVFKNVLTQLNEKYNATTGKDFPFVVAQMRNKFKWCVSTCKKICLTVKTASGITRFIEDKGYGKWFNLLYVLVKTRDSCKPENACEPSALGRDADCIDYGINEADDKGEGSSTSSNFTNKSSDLPFKQKVAPVKKPTFKKRKTDQLGKALELLQATIDHDPAKELLQILKEDMKASREQEMRYFQMMCGLINPTISPKPLANGNPHHYHSPTLQPFYYGTSPKEDQHQLSGFQAFNQSVQQNSVFLPYSASSRPHTPSSSNPLTVSPGSADQSFLNHVQAAGASQQQGFVPQYEELRPITPTYIYEDSTGPSEGGWDVTGRFGK